MKKFHKVGACNELLFFFQLLRPAIIVALEEKLGHYFTPEVGQAWERVFNYIGSKIMKGISKWNKHGNSKR